MNKKPPTHPRPVLTWVKDRNGMEFWQLDSYWDDDWFEATTWDHKVLYWEELREKPSKSEIKR